MIYALITVLAISVLGNIVSAVILKKMHDDDCDRIMAKSLGEYSASRDDTPREQAESAHEKAIRKWRNKGRPE